MTKLDYSLQSPEERNELVKKILEENPYPSERYLEVLTDYLILCLEKQEKKERKILTDNRLTTINKRECSFEGLVAQLENGEDGIYNLMSESKQTIFQPKVTITKKDLQEIPLLNQLRESIENWEHKLSHSSGRDAFVIKKALIEMRKDQYLIKNAYRRPITPKKITRSKTPTRLPDNTSTFNSKGYPIPQGVSLLNSKICSAILCNYSQLKEGCWGDFENDTWFLMYDFDQVSEKALAPFPLYRRIVELKIDGLPNTEIQQILLEEFGVTHSLEYISSLWRNKIPKLIASIAEDEYLYWYYQEVEKGTWKRCSRCGQIKLAHNKYFSRNKTSKDGYYSICKSCRNRRAEKR